MNSETRLKLIARKAQFILKHLPSPLRYIANDLTDIIFLAVASDEFLELNIKNFSDIIEE